MGSRQNRHLQLPEEVAVLSPPLCPSQVRQQLERICASEEFQRSLRSRRFLTYIVEETIAGRGSRIKAYCVATSALDRDETFDPQADPLVRIEAGQLRRRLERYYLTQGAEDPVLIDLPKGGYIPVFNPRPALNPSSVFNPGTPRVPGASRATEHLPAGVSGTLALAALSAVGLLGAAYVVHDPGMVASAMGVPAIRGIQVLPFTPAEDPRSAEVAAGMADEITQELTRRRDLAVLGPRGPGTGKPSRPDAILTGTVRTGSGVVRVTASLVSARNGTYIWTKAYDRPSAGPVLALQSAVAAEIGAGLDVRAQGQRD
ncbi:hypothetical protein JL101_015580 [Skermanella rosea]|uniref:hypothetical protein n=1 Tax=Skermanella rosea TaxID=1817965 RepID=UPI0019331A7B|nr:hypothetical protein [Skermanella rosea]UEM01429.1 hypothetical protein JL101_015580 [Skermanella rosea]